MTVVSKPHLIGLVGKAGSGKDTVRKLLVDHYGFYGFAFADPLKRMLAAIGINEPPREQKEDPLPLFGFSYRLAAQKLGTEWGRELDKDIWLNLGKRKIEAKHQFNRMDVVISDVRFPNEADMIRELGGVIVKLTGRNYEVANSGHASEVLQDSIVPNWLIENTGSMANLSDAVRRLMNHLNENDQFNV